MAEMPNIDPNFEPQSRPRSGTWPLNRPNIPSIRNRLHGMGGGTLLDATLEEANSQELIADPNMMLEFPKDDYLPMLSPDSMLNPSGFGVDSVLIGLPTGPTANLVEDYPLSGTLVKPEPSNNNNILGDYCATTTTITELSNLNDSQSFDDIRGMPESMQCQTASSSANFSPVGNTTPPASTTVSSSQSSTSATSGATPKAKSTRKNAWGNMSYADLITQAIESSPEKRLTLAQIYEWMVKNVAYFKDKGDSNSSAGWKNSIRHNLSLHAKFKRIQNEGTGKSSWWVINHDAKPGKPARRRVQSMDNANQKYNRSKNKALAKQKAELIKKQKAGLKAGESWPGTSGLETTVSKALGSEYRQRASSNASSIAGRLSPLPLFPSQDLEEDTGPNMSPMGSAANLANLSSSSLPSAFDIFSVVRSDNTSSAIPENNEMLHDNLLDSLANIAVVSSPGPYGDQQVDSKSGIYLQQLNDGQQQNRNRKNLVNNPAQNSPNLASLLQRNPKSPPKNSSTPITKREPEWNESKTPYVYSDYQSPQIMGQVMQSPPQQYKPQMNDGKPMYRYVMPRQNVPENSRYAQPGQMRPPAQVNYIQQQQQQTEMQRYLANQQRQQQQMVQQMENPPPQYPGQQSNLVSMNVKFPSDLNLDNQELYDSGDLDMSEALEGIQPSNDSYNFNMMDFDGKPANFFQQQLLQESNEYNMAMNGNNGLVQHQQAPPVMHPNPDIFITNQGPGTASMDSMMDGCRMNTATNFQRTQQGQTPSVGAASGYTMQ